MVFDAQFASTQLLSLHFFPAPCVVCESLFGSVICTCPFYLVVSELQPTGHDVNNYALWLAMSTSRPMQFLVDGESFAANLEAARQVYAALPQVYEIAENGQLTDWMIAQVPAFSE